MLRLLFTTIIEVYPTGVHVPPRTPPSNQLYTNYVKKQKANLRFQGAMFETIYIIHQQEMYIKILRISV